MGVYISSPQKQKRDVRGQEVRGYKAGHSKKPGLRERGCHYAGMDNDDQGWKIRAIARYGKHRGRMLFYSVVYPLTLYPWNGTGSIKTGYAGICPVNDSF